MNSKSLLTKYLSSPPPPRIILTALSHPLSYVPSDEKISTIRPAKYATHGYSAHCRQQERR